MLVKFQLKNFKSFKNNTVIDLNSTNYKILSTRNVADNGILKGLMFVGANASGKTNIILAVKVLLDMLFSESITEIGDYFCLFGEGSSIVLNYEFLIDDNNICYSITYDIKKHVMIEKLYLNNKLVIDRIGKNATSQITENTIFDDIDDNILLLRQIYFNTKFYGNDVLKKWFQFLLNSAYIDLYKRKVFSPGKHPLLIEEYLDKQGVATINEFFNEFDFNQRVEFTDQSRGNKVRISTGGEKAIFFKRKSIDEPIPYSFESLGNQNLLNLLPSFFHVINNGGILLIDEFSSGFHNELEEILMKYFMKKSRDSQIFIVSHSTNLISNTIFRPDQIYSVDFNGNRGSSIKRFSTEKPREAQNLEKMYVSGVFNGLPNYRQMENK